jgi:hypothetical protein
MVAVGADMHASWASVEGRGRRSAAVSSILAVVGVHSGGDVGSILVDGVLHLA